MVVPPMGVLSVGSGKGSCLFSLGDCLDIGVGGAAMGGCSFAGEPFVVEQMGTMGMLVPIECDMRWP